MFKRIRWMSIGAAAGLGGSVWAQRRVRQTVERYLPEQMGMQAAQRVRDLRDDLLDAVDEGREAMRSREAELRTQLKVPATPAAQERLALPRAERGRRPGNPPAIDVAEGGRPAGRPAGPAKSVPGWSRSWRSGPRRRRPGE